MTARGLAAAAMTVAALAGCSLFPKVAPELPAPVAVHVSEPGSAVQRDFPADSEAARRLKAWVDANQDGWMPLLYTPPFGGSLHVDAGSLHLEFAGTVVRLSVQGKGYVTKAAVPSDYAFLRP